MMGQIQERRNIRELISVLDDLILTLETDRYDLPESDKERVIEGVDADKLRPSRLVEPSEYSDFEEFNRGLIFAAESTKRVISFLYTGLFPSPFQSIVDSVGEEIIRVSNTKHRESYLAGLEHALAEVAKLCDSFGDI